MQVTASMLVRIEFKAVGKELVIFTNATQEPIPVLITSVWPRGIEVPTAYLIDEVDQEMNKEQ